MTESLSELVLQTDSIRLTLLPEVGCKITKLEFLRYDFQWLWQDEHRPVRKPEFCGDYAAYDISGFDECFPNIAVSKYPLDDQIKLCDHGEVWAKPWRVEMFENSIAASVDLTAMPLTFKREIVLSKETIYFNYEVINTGDFSYWYMWSAHPLFRLPNKYRILVPAGQKMYKEFGFGGRLGPDGEDGYQGHLSELSWPKVSSDTGLEIDLSEVVPDLGVTDKVSIETSGIQELMLINEELLAGLSFKFSAEINHVGICSNLTAWPAGPHPATWIAIEPMIGISDRLDENIKLGAATEIGQGETHSWNFSITLVDLDTN
jgi:galactose mutarotase-like enzyme